MKPFWHPLSSVYLTDPEVLATPAAIRLLLRAGAIELRYAGDRMWPAIRDGQTVRLDPLSGRAPTLGEVVLGCAEGIPDLLRVRASDGAQVHLHGDADPGAPVVVAIEDVLARARLPSRRTSAIGRVARRFVLDLGEAARRVPDTAENPAASVRGKYEAQAAYYASAGGTGDMEAALLARARRLFPGGCRVLVAGSGSGRECIALAAVGYEVRGIDFAPAMVEAARREAGRRGSGATFVLGDLRVHDEPAGSLGGILFTYDVYSFIAERAERVGLLSRMARWLAPGGAVLLSARRIRRAYERLVMAVQRNSASGRLKGSTHTRWIDLDGRVRRSFVRMFSDGELRREVEEAGLRARAWEGGHVELRLASQEGS